MRSTRYTLGLFPTAAQSLVVCAATYFSHLLQASSGSYNIIKTQAVYYTSVNGKHIYFSITQESVDVQYY